MMHLWRGSRFMLVIWVCSQIKYGSFFNCRCDISLRPLRRKAMRFEAGINDVAQRITQWVSKRNFFSKKFGSPSGPEEVLGFRVDSTTVALIKLIPEVTSSNLLVIPVSKCESCTEEIVRDWISSYNLCLNHVKFMKIVSPRFQHAVVIPLPAVPTIPRVDEIKALGITISRKFSVAQQVNHLVSCA